MLLGIETIFILFLHAAPLILHGLFIQNFTLSPTSIPLWRRTVNLSLITGIVLVFLLLGYLVYALVKAEEF
nr:K(+)-transporting ATPase subunit F [Sodalis sp. dw_96]